MPIYQYENKHYSLPDGLSPEEAKAKIFTAIGKTMAPAVPKEASWGTAFSQKLAEAGNAADSALSLPAGALANVFSTDEADKVFSELEARKKYRLKTANPDNLPLSTTQGVVGSVATLPAQLVGMLGAPAEKGMDLIGRGESLSTAVPATYAETALNAAGLGPMQAAKSFLGRAAIGGAANMATGAGSDAITQMLASQQSTKDAYDPYNVEKRVQEGLVGGVLQGALGERPAPTGKVGKVGKIKEQQAAIDASKPPVEPSGVVDPLVDTKPSLLKSKEAYERALRERKLAEDSAFSDKAYEQRAKDEMDGTWEMGALRDTMDEFEGQVRQSAAQKALDQRQKALESQVKQALDNNPRPTQPIIDAIAKIQAELERTRQLAEEAKVNENSERMGNAQQMLIDDTPHALPDSNEVIAPQYGAMQGAGRFDENGMPIRADLSMEAANLENPLQRNLWGDELPRKGLQEAPRGITKAMDITPEGPMRDAQLSALGAEPRGFWANWKKNAPTPKPKKYNGGKGGGVGKRHGGEIDLDLLGVGMATRLIKTIIDTVKEKPVKSILEKYKGTFNEEALVRAYNQSLDPKGKEHLVLMSPDIFHALASDRGSHALTSLDSGKRRASVREGLATEAGLTDIPYLIVNAKGEVTGHEGRHRMDIIKARGLDGVPVRIMHPEWRNMPGDNDAPKPNITQLIPEKGGAAAIDRKPQAYPKPLMEYGRGEEWVNGGRFGKSNAEMRSSGINAGHKQSGALDLSIKREGYGGLFKSLSKLTDMAWLKEKFPADKFMTNSDGTPLVMLHGTTKNFRNEIVASREGIHTGFVSSPHMFVTDKSATVPKGSLYGGWGFQNPKATKEGGNIRPVVLKKGNYPLLKFDVGMWEPKNMFRDPRFREWFMFEAGKKNISPTEVKSLINYVENGIEFGDTNQRFTDVLKRVGVDGFFYKNSAESPHRSKTDILGSRLMKEEQRRLADINSFQTKPDTSKFLEQKKQLESISQDPTSFVTWDRKNITSVYHDPEVKVPFNFKGQGGGVKMDWSAPEKEQPLLSNAMDIADEALIPKNPNVEAVVAKALEEGKDGKFFKYLQSGATSTAMKTGSAAIKAAAEIIQNAGKRSELAIRKIVFPAETALRKLSSSELMELADVFKDEMFTGRRFDGDVLSGNLTVKQLEAYVQMREMFDKALDAQNAERVLKGLKPIKASEAYMSSRWDGDFRRPIKDANGNTVWYLASNTTRGLESQTKALLAKFPELKFDPKDDHTVSSKVGKTDLQSMYTTMLDILGRDDPAIQKIKDAIEEQTIAEGKSNLGQEQHFKHKGNVRGFVGDRPGSSPKVEAINMFHEQLQYAKNAFTWTEMQTAANDIKGLISDPDLKAQQPNNVNYIREYFKNAIGHSEARAIQLLGDDIRSGLGVSPKVFDDAIGNVKSFFILQKLAASAGFTLANVVQSTNVLPYLVDLHRQGYKGNPVTALALGFPTGLMMMTSHYLKSVGGEYMDRLPNQFLKDAIHYAEANGVTSRSVYDESPLETGFSPVKGAVNLASKTMTIPETFVRSVAFMTYAQMLKDSGKYADQSKLFQHAEELVNMSMVDYRNTEKPLMFAKAGTMGKFLNTLQTFPVSFYNQYGYMARQASTGNAIPLVTMLALQAAMGGAMAVPYSEDLYRLFSWTKNNVASDAQWKAMQESPFLSDPKLWMMETLGKAAVYGYVSDKTGLGLSSRISAPAVSEMFQSPVGPIVDIAGQVHAVGKAALDPMNATKRAQAAMKVVPIGLAGLLETSGVMEDYTYTTRKDGTRTYVKTNDIAARVGTITRSPEEDAVRKWGLRSQREVVEKDVQYITGQNNKAARERIGGASGGAGELMEKIYDAMRRGDKESTKRLGTLYTQLSGREINEDMIKRQILQERMTSLERTLARSEKLTPQELINNARMVAILKDSK